MNQKVCFVGALAQPARSSDFSRKAKNAVLLTISQLEMLNINSNKDSEGQAILPLELEATGVPGPSQSFCSNLSSHLNHSQIMFCATCHPLLRLPPLPGVPLPQPLLYPANSCLLVLTLRPSLRCSFWWPLYPQLVSPTTFPPWLYFWNVTVCLISLVH